MKKIIPLILVVPFIATGALAGANKASIIDACDINPVFCGADGTSDLPDFASGFAIYNVTGDGTGLLTAMVKGSLADTAHSVFLCPGDLTPTGGFQNCTLVGTFTTNINGNGAFHKEFPSFPPTETVIAINVAGFSTVLANCPDDPDAFCDPDPLQ